MKCYFERGFSKKKSATKIGVFKKKDKNNQNPYTFTKKYHKKPPMTKITIKIVDEERHLRF